MRDQLIEMFAETHQNRTSQRSSLPSIPVEKLPQSDPCIVFDFARNMYYPSELMDMGWSDSRL